MHQFFLSCTITTEEQCDISNIEVNTSVSWDHYTTDYWVNLTSYKAGKILAHLHPARWIRLHIFQEYDKSVLAHREKKPFQIRLLCGHSLGRIKYPECQYTECVRCLWRFYQLRICSVNHLCHLYIHLISSEIYVFISCHVLPGSGRRSSTVHFNSSAVEKLLDLTV